MTVNVHNAKTNLSKLLAKVERGEEVVIARAGKPVAKLVAIKPERHRLVPGNMKGRIKLTKRFFEPMPEEFMKHFR